VTFSKENLEKIMASCIAMATLDGEITEDEIHPVVAFVENNWKSDYGDINDFSVKARDGAEDILKSSSLTESIGEIADSLSSSLDAEQKESVLKLLSVVLHADDEGHDLEHAMYNIFTQRFHS
jgi:uncharacterized tellurite resistance protein B-like protein